MLPPTPNIKPNHQSRWIWPSQHTTTQLQYALSWFASCYLSPNVSSWNTDKKHKKKTSQKAQLLGHLNATTFSQFLKTICAPGHRSITWNARLRSPCLGPIRNPNVSRQAPTNSLLGHAKYTSLYADSNLPCSYLYKFSCRSLEVHHCVAKMVYDDDFSHQSPRYVVFPSSLEVQRLEVQRNQSSWDWHHT